MTRILVVDDEPQIRKALEVNLVARDYEVVTAATGEAALIAASDHPPDIVLLDLGLPGIDGMGVIAGLRGWTSVPIIVLSVRGEESDKVAALDAGADDYVSKPFGMGELLARLRAALRRSHPEAAEPMVRTPHFVVDLVTTKVTGGTDSSAPGGEIHLTPIEWAIVEHLVRNPGRLVTQRQLLERVWGPGHEGQSNYLRVHLANVRRKLEPEPSAPRYFLTEPGMGYRFVEHIIDTDR